jgi:Zn-dependent metalloprotease
MRPNNRLWPILLIVLYSALAVAQDMPAPARKALTSQGRVDHVLLNERGLPSFIRGDFDYSKSGAPEQIALAFLTVNRDLFHMDDPQSEFIVEHSTADEKGNIQVSLAQRYQDLPVFQGEIMVHVGKNGHIREVNGLYLDGLKMDTKPTITAAEAKRLMLADMGKPEVDSLSRPPTLVIARVDDNDHLAWRAKVSAKDMSEAWDYFIDARDGSLLQRFTAVAE